MKVTITEAADILRELKAGKHIQGIDRHGRGVGHVYYNDGCICWNHYGSSANEANIHGVQFIMEKIFHECVTWDFCIWSDYHINHIPVNPKYSGVDLSYNHPNTFGI